MRTIFIAIAKVVGIAWIAFAAALLISVGVLLLNQPREREHLSAEVLTRFLTAIGLLLQLCLAVSLTLATEFWANLTRVPRDTPALDVTSNDLLSLGTKLIGIYYVIQGVPGLASEWLAILHPTAPPVTGVVDVVPLIQPGLTILFGALFVFNSSAIVSIINRTGSSEPAEEANASPTGDA